MSFQRIVIGVDFSAASLAAARWIAQLAPGAELVLVHVLPEPEAPVYVRDQLPPMLEVIRDLEPAMRGGLRGLADLIDGTRTRVEILRGQPAEGLATAAAQLGADLVCVGRMRSRRGGARFGATTAHRLLARTGVPVLVVPGGPLALPHRVLTCVDDRAATPGILERAWQVAAHLEARLDALHVIEAPLRDLVRACQHLDEEEGGEGSFGERALLDAAEGWLRQALRAALVPEGRGAPLVRVGEPGQEAIAAAREGGADLIVIGRGGDRAAAFSPYPHVSAGAPLPPRQALGSTARMVMWAAPAPVLLLPPVPDDVRPDGTRGARHEGRRGTELRFRTTPLRPTPPFRPAADGGTTRWAS